MGPYELPVSKQAREFNIGGVGHRHLPAAKEQIFDQVMIVVRRVIADATGLQPVLVCSVAEGADRLLIGAARALAVPYECVLPCSPACFREDFVSRSSRDEFDWVLEGARAVSQPSADLDKEAGYLWAADMVVDGADTLIAIWDGKPGRGDAGTSATVVRALAKGVPVTWISSNRPHEVRMLTSGIETFR